MTHQKQEGSIVRFTRLMSIFVLTAAACGGDDSTPPGVDSGADGGEADAPTPEPDAAPADAAPPDAPAATGIGGLCPVGDECAVGLFCLDDMINAGLPADGYCSKTCTGDADCGWDSFCSPPTPGGGPQFCFQACTTDETACTGYPARVCSRFVLGFDLGQAACLWGNPAAEDGSPCDDGSDCNAGQICLNNPFKAPGGLCLTVGCTVGDDTTCVGPDSICVDTPGGGGPATICFDTCTLSTDCRDAEGYACITPPGAPFSFCFYPAGDAGDPCAASTDCGPVGSPWACLMGATFPGGYCSAALGTCTADPATCPMDSLCYDAGTPLDTTDDYCAPVCSVDAECRMAESYGCLLSDPADTMSQRICIFDMP